MYSQSVPALISKNVGSALTNYKTWGGIIYNVISYGAVGDGVHDDTAAINAAITACPVGGTVFFPEPPVKYILKSTLQINKPIKLMGFNKTYENEGNLEKEQILEFGSGVFTGLHITSYEVTIENLNIVMTDVGNSMVAGIDFDSTTPGYMHNCHVLNVIVSMPHQYGSGIRGRNMIVSTFKNVQSWQGQYGFYFYSTGTSLTFDNCWAKYQPVGGSGYYMYAYYYCAFLGCAADTTNNGDYAYYLDSCFGVSFLSCGGEVFGKTMFRLNSCDGVKIDGCEAVNMNNAGTAVASFAEITGTSKNIVMAGSVDYQPAGSLPNVRVDSTSSYPVMINCDFPNGFSNNGNVTAPLSAKASLQLGYWGLYQSPGAAASTVFDGANLAARTPYRIGVFNSDYTQWLGYINGDGTILVGSLASLPTASSAYRGVMARVLGNGTTTADVLYMCMMSATGTYSWKQIVAG